ncbi:hypothetical protein M378DRAFT_948806 [Amanita muscaria Koide BX008]|uniref:Uncharacterized protein n=1 Tax=Amanita muscaria (strain Koide BX008) TaxID=946122 RepID=A0A0C2WFP6_AMAMK|nr:hypothetical protein M378DRAFT_948806 [Amanita muscaria Koide BX008]
MLDLIRAWQADAAPNRTSQMSSGRFLTGTQPPYGLATRASLFLLLSADCLFPCYITGAN